MTTFVIEAFARQRFEDLVEELDKWRAARGIKGRPDAYKLLKGKPSADEREFLRDYVKRWEARCIGDA